MVSGKFKSRSLRRVKVTTPGNRNKIVYKQRKPSQAKCAACGAILSGVPRATKSEITNMPKTAKRPERPFGGFLCSKCLRVTMKDKARNLEL